MNLVSIKGCARHLPLKVPFAISKETLPAAAVGYLQVDDLHGNSGIGELAPFPSLTGDRLEDSLPAALSAGQELLGCSSEEGLERLAKMRPSLFKVYPTAYVALEMALWDLQAKQQKTSLAALWGVPKTDVAFTDLTLPLMAPELVAPFAGAFRDFNFPIFKIKVSGNLDRDLKLIRALVAVLDTDIKITLDGNQGYSSPSEAIRLISQLRLEGIHPLFFEQPLAENDWSGLAELQKEIPIPICLDESVRTHKDAQRCAETMPGAMINLKIMKSGIQETRQIINVAADSEIPLMIGGMMETEVAMATSLHLALASGSVAFFDLDTPFFLKDLVSVESPWHRKSAQLSLPTGLGHGIQLRDPI